MTLRGCARGEAWSVDVFLFLSTSSNRGAACVHLSVSEKFESNGRAFRSAGRSAGLAVRPFRPRDLVTIPDYVRLADIRAVVEVVPAGDGKPPECLLWNAYRASWSGVIALALNSVTIEAVNRVMDGIVPHFPLDIPGVVYIDTQNRPLLAWVLNNADLIFGQTNEFRRMAPKTSIVLMPYLLGEFKLGVSKSASSDGAAPFANSIGTQR